MILTYFNITFLLYWERYRIFALYKLKRFKQNGRDNNSTPIICDDKVFKRFYKDSMEEFNLQIKNNKEAKQIEDKDQE